MEDAWIWSPFSLNLCVSWITATLLSDRHCTSARTECCCMTCPITMSFLHSIHYPGDLFVIGFCSRSHYYVHSVHWPLSRVHHRCYDTCRQQPLLAATMICHQIWLLICSSMCNFSSWAYYVAGPELWTVDLSPAVCTISHNCLPVQLKTKGPQFRGGGIRCKSKIKDNIW